MSHRPVAIIWDEFHLTLTKTDVAFQSIARSSGCAVVAATQNLPPLKDALGGELALGFLGNFRTQIFCQNPDSATGDYMSKRCGKVLKKCTSTTRTQDGKTSATVNKELKDALPLHAAHNLKTGGEDNHYIVTAFLTMGGKKIDRFLGASSTYLKLKFHQLKLRNWIGSGLVSVVARRRPCPDFRYLRKDS